MKRLLLILLVVAAVLTVGCPKAPPATRVFSDISAKDAFTLIQNNQGNPDFIILDVRTAGEFAQGHIENAINIDKNSETFREKLNQLDKDKTYLVYCAVGGRSAGARDIMQELGFMEVYNMQGGISQWQQEGLPTVE